MSILSDHQIRRLATERRMIEPFESRQVREREVLGPTRPGETLEPVRVFSYGCSSYGYDMRIADEFKVFTPVYVDVVDPKYVPESAFVSVSGKGSCVIPPNSFALSRSIERFEIPRYVLAVVLGKSSYARVGVVVNVTPLEPGWCGYVTVEISNTAPLPVRVYGNEGIAQVLFFHADSECETSYADRAGKYQDQPAEIVLPR